MDFLINLPAPLSWPEIGCAILCGLIVGMERQIRGKPAGIRTSVLVCLGTQVFVQLGVLVSNDVGDPARVLGQVITGIGFIGAGVILAQGGRVVGVTTATVVWMLAAIGSTIGFGYIRAALVLTVVTVITLTSLDIIDRKCNLIRNGERSNDH